MQICDKLHAFIWRTMGANNCNSYFIDGSQRVLIDPGHLQFFGHVRQGLGDLGVGIEDIDVVICTHVHPDHSEAVRLFKEAGARIGLHAEEWQLAETMASQLQLAGAFEPADYLPDFFLQTGELHLGDIGLQVLHTPGHSPGSICLYWPLHKVLFSGDLVFKDGVGRTDLPGGDGRQLAASIAQIAQLPIDHLLAGHGEVVSGDQNVQTNFKRIGQVYLDFM